MADYFPPVGFHYLVEFLDREGDAEKLNLDKEKLEIGFQSVSGLSVDFQTESIKEGGEHRFEHVLPLRTKYNNLVLKRAMVANSKLINWCLDAFENLTIHPKNILVKLLNEEHEPLVTWDIVHAWPKKWSVSDLNAESSALVIETLELQYHYFTIK